MCGPTLSRWHWLFAFIIVTNVPSTLAEGPLFQQFFPGWDGLIKGYLNESCSDQLAEYNKDPMGEGKWKVIDCLFDDPFSETRKAEAAAAALTLGLAPMVLQTIGPSTSETSLLFTRRPLLALLLAISSPWPRNPDDNAIYTDSTDPAIPTKIFTESLLWFEPMVLLVEYALALGAAANVALLAYQLGHWAFFMSANNVNDPVWWTYCSFLIHLIGILGIFLRFRLGESNGVFDTETAKMHWFQRWSYHEFRPAAYNNKDNDTNNMNGSPKEKKKKNLLTLKTRKWSEKRWNHWITLLSVLATWTLSIAPTLQVLMGTIMLSGSLLTNQADARNCLFRYVCSAIVARALLSFELTYLTRVVDPKDRKDMKDPEEGERENSEKTMRTQERHVLLTETSF
ncbi:hypothetical protein GCG54_00012506 [Colletotrichum gloeosporioides]|uniref:Uncharacterized protein n=1 Tax=Colletotrichum gloeosporioides TaxID=474922 RepID=A0A8H4CE03_COLGL|nr:uncharacterized protein GCG54_00012506 [Colletotrichum gloeosporioides]KAF3802258.1 hypothetical protein GCG54_00012506 [Colletotrichum gloeosporioides]